MKAHTHAHDVAHILHRDVSVGNILITMDGRGMLADWELSQDMDSSQAKDGDTRWRTVSGFFATIMIA